MTSREFEFDSPAGALAAILDRVAPVGVERTPLESAAGRVLAASVASDRPSPAIDVSAMDGFAVRVRDLGRESIAVLGEARAGEEPPAMPAEGCLRIVTGAPVPPGAELVVRREDVEECEGSIRPKPEARRLAAGANIRRRGENLEAGAEVAHPGRPIDGPLGAALSTFGELRPAVFRRVRVRLVITGDEVLPAGSSPAPWQVRDGNGLALRGLLAPCPWIELTARHAPDNPARIRAEVEEGLGTADAIVLTGGVSMGDRDFVPGVLESLGCERVFHRLPQRPGKPMLAAVGSAGVPVFGLPGNPVSVLVTARRYVAAVLSRRAGFGREPVPESVALTEPDGRVLGLWWFRLVQRVSPGRVSLIDSRGSGDVPSAARSDGFVELAPGDDASGSLAFYPWRL